MKTYDETFERVMAERDSYMLKRKKTIKCAALSSTALVAVALCVFTATRAGNTGMINKKSADNNSEAAMVSDNSEYTVPELLSQEITSYFGVEDTTHISEEYTASVQQAADPDAKSQYDSLNETQTAADLCAGVPSKNSGATTTTRGETIPATSKAIVEESALCSVYKYHINSGKYKNYIAGKVIEKEKVGEKIGSVTVTGGWQGTGNATTKETLSADV
ncbi:MAG: hypothetical protein IKH13_00485, partial [Clostridia bacterium]|nr:hypothetical protein [Clostridia bacterium]